MNMLKNLMLIAVLAAVGYELYVSLARNNVDPAPGHGTADVWATGPKTEMGSNNDRVSSNQSSNGPLAIHGNVVPVSNNEALPSNNARSSLGTTFPQTPVLPTTNLVPPASPATSQLNDNSPKVVPIAPYTSSSTWPQNDPLTKPATVASGSSGASASFGSPAVSEPSASGVSGASTTVAASVGSSESVKNLVPPPLAIPKQEEREPYSPPETADPNALAPPAGSPADNLLQSRFASFMDAVQKTLDEGKYAEAQLVLSKLYDNPDLPTNQAKQITTLLDKLAGTVIYSRKHYLEPAYLVQQGDTLESVAKKYEVPWLLLAKINGLMEPNNANLENPIKDQPLPPGKELKVVRGPFDAVIRLETHELTLMVQRRYAGRFPIGIGRDQPKLDGNYTVCSKQLYPDYRGPDGVSYASNDPQNPLGAAWIGLNERIGIHGTNDPQAVGRDGNRGTLCVSNRDLQDLYGILTVGSHVTILR